MNGKESPHGLHVGYCGKRIYETRTAARKKSKELRKDNYRDPGRTNIVLNEYFCEPCNGWHVGHRKKWWRKE